MYTESWGSPQREGYSSVAGMDCSWACSFRGPELNGVRVRHLRVLTWVRTRNSTATWCTCTSGPHALTTGNRQQLITISRKSDAATMAPEHGEYEALSSSARRQCASPALATVTILTPPLQTKGSSSLGLPDLATQLQPRLNLGGIVQPQLCRTAPPSDISILCLLPDPHLPQELQRLAAAFRQHVKIKDRWGSAVCHECCWCNCFSSCALSYKPKARAPHAAHCALHTALHMISPVLCIHHHCQRCHRQDAVTVALSLRVAAPGALGPSHEATACPARLRANPHGPLPPATLCVNLHCPRPCLPACRRYLFRTYRQCFVGQEAVAWMVASGWAADTRVGVRLGTEWCASAQAGSK